MADQPTIQQFVTVFRTHIESVLSPKIQTAMAEQRRVEEARQQQWKGFSTAGVSWPSSSYGISVHGNAFHFNMPTALATEENCAHVEDALTAAEEATGLMFDGRRTRGGNNFVVDGRLDPKPEPVPGLSF